MKSVKEKFDKLPKDIQIILFSDLDFVLNKEINQKYNLSEEQSVNNTKIIGSLLFLEMPISKLMTTLKETFNFDDNKTKQIALDIIGKRLLIFDNYFNKEASQFIVSNNGDINKYADDIKRQNEEIEKVKAEEKEEEKQEAVVEKKEEPSVGPVKFVEPIEEIEKKDAPEVFQKSITAFLEVENEELIKIVEDLNDILITILIKDREFKQSLQNALFSNQENLTDKYVILDNRNQPPTVANWLKDFITMQGTNNFNELMLSQYLIRSQNARNLGPKEKEVLRKLLILYKNVKFFPDSMKDIPPDKWEIIPVDHDAVEIKFKKNSDGYSEIELKKIADNYAPGSLERRAVEEEIRKLGN
jgi:hypothetical protein